MHQRRQRCFKQYKFSKPGRRNFTRKKFRPGFAGTRSPIFLKRFWGPRHISRNENREKSVCGLANFCFARDAKFPAGISSCSGRKCTRFPIHFSIGLSEKISVQAEVAPGWACPQNFRQRGPPGGGRAERGAARAEPGGFCPSEEPGGFLAPRGARAGGPLVRPSALIEPLLNPY